MRRIARHSVFRSTVTPSRARPAKSQDQLVRYVVRLGESFSDIHLDRIHKEMKGLRIAVGRYFAPIHLQPAYGSSTDNERLAVTEFEAQRTIALPFFNQIRAEQVDEVSESLSELCKAL